MSWRRGQAYSQDLRERVFLAADAEVPVGQVAAMVSTSVSYVSEVLSHWRLTGETTARPQCCHVPRKWADHLAALRARVEAKPDATIEALRLWLRKTCGVLASAMLVWEALAELNLILKKALACRRAELSGRSPGVCDVA